MVVISIIAASLCLINIIMRIAMYKYIQKLEYRLKNLSGNLEDAENFKAAVKLTYGDPVEIWEDALLICSEQKSNEKAIIYDFSRWDDKKIIGVISMHPNARLDEDGDPRINIVPKQKVFRYEDGTILWSPQLQ